MDINTNKSYTKYYVIAWIFGLIFYFLDYVIRSAPAVMFPELSQSFSVNEIRLVEIVGTYYYTYSTCSLIAGIALDRFGAKYSLFAGALILGIGCLLFMISSQFSGVVGRLFQGAGCAFAFPGCVYLASKGFSAKSLATAIGFTQCLGMLGGSAGQFVVGPLIEEGMNINTFWLSTGIFTIIVAFGLWFITPSNITDKNIESTQKKQSLLNPYKIVFSNPQSWFCGIISGLLFAPTTIFAMTWAVDFFQKDRAFDFHTATISSAMVAFGWVFGCPLLGYITDKINKRKPVLVFGAVFMIVALIQLLYFPNLLPAKYSMFSLGVASGAAMIPYSIIKEANPDNVKGSATGAINFITFGVTTLLSPLFSRLFGRTLDGTLDKTNHFQQAGLFWIIGISIAILVSFLLKETGSGKKTDAEKVII
ncbi:MFS transporter [Flavobacterium sp. S87F.05.LMB.W.Kidney.N]|uniref:MFS transporter n=1 Tax=Flavobacterium sp. S87F.05.LMB.W.Kidney.N TaxID=1278758 RepID=UPI0010667E46|nr:MFS transporter [Flavobacterium sp. S87F.05.LMB.W.Kidney.N]TDX11524.1 sugar phosphate permease [Flavobacterium sp. S87F.05.LMB.W.Kidney.N]